MLCLTACACAALLTGCTHPLATTLEQRLREQLAATSRAYIKAVQDAQPIQLQRTPSDVEKKLTPQRREQLDAMSGVGAYANDQLQLGPDLTAVLDRPTIAITLRRAIQVAVRSNLAMREARLVPAIQESILEQSEAVFDAVFFTNVQYTKLDTPRPTVQTGGGSLDFLGSIRAEQGTFTSGIRKPLTTGGQATFQTTATPDFSDPSSFSDDGRGFQFYGANIEFIIEQPLLRNIGTDVTRSNIERAKIGLKASEFDVHTTLLQLIHAVEQAYWAVVIQQQALLIQQRQHERTKETRDKIESRIGYDATPAQVTQANSSVELARANVIRSAHAVRRASDELKALINVSQLPISNETLLLPLDEPVDLPIEFSLLDAVSSALQNRPEVQRSLLEIEDATIRQRVADNQRLPQLDVSATIRYSGIGGTTGRAYEEVTTADFVEYLLGAVFEMPIGNRQAEAAYRQSQLEKRRSLITYQRTAQDVVIEVKAALRNLQMDYELIAAQRAARRSAADFVRTLQEQEKAGEALTPEFSNRKLDALRALAETELQELQALIDYNVAISEYYRTIGTLLERNGIDFQAKPID